MIGFGRRFLATTLAICVVGTAAAVTLGAQRDTQNGSLVRLKAGNARFVADAAEALPITAPRRTELAQGQAPFATVLSCADSRVPPEIIFHTGLGDLFVVRAAGHVPDRSVLASLEYGAEHLHVPLLLVMGHEMCGAVKAAVETPATKSLGPNLDYLLKAIRPAVARASSQPPETRLRAAILENVEETINVMLDSSAVLKHLAATERLTIAGAYYELASGRVHFSEPVRVPPGAPRPDKSSTTSHERTELRGTAAAPATPHPAPPAPVTPVVASIVPPKPQVQSSKPPAAAPAKPQATAVVTAQPAGSVKPQQAAQPAKPH